MKIRNGFVSNSSSSSFMIYGGELNVRDNEEELYQLICKGKSEEEIKGMDSCVKDGDEFDTYELTDYVEELLPKGHSLYYGGYDSGKFVGVDPSDQKDDQTHGDWKKQIEEDLTNAFGSLVSDFGWHEDCSYDG